jgi:hypothetical protein
MTDTFKSGDSARTDTFTYFITDSNCGLVGSANVTITRAPASVSGFVYVDLNNNGIKDPGEAGVPNVRITLFKLVGSTYVQQTSMLTNSAGFYQFSNLPPGTYKVVETEPTNFLQGKKTVGTVNGVKDGVDPTRAIAAIVLNPGNNGINYNFAVLPSKIHFV